MRAAIIARHSQRVASQRSNSAENFEGSSPSDSKTEEPRRSGRVRALAVKLVEKSSQQQKRLRKRLNGASQGRRRCK